jgi:hypothetical protein
MPTWLLSLVSSAPLRANIAGIPAGRAGITSRGRSPGVPPFLLLLLRRTGGSETVSLLLLLLLFWAVVWFGRSGSCQGRPVEGGATAVRPSRRLYGHQPGRLQLAQPHILPTHILQINKGFFNQKALNCQVNPLPGAPCAITHNKGSDID